MKTKNVYITWHYTTHGIAYFKHVLSHFYQTGLPAKEINFGKLNQEELSEVFDNPEKEGKKFTFDEVVYFIAPQEAFDRISTRRFAYKKTILEDELIIQKGLKEIFEEIIADDSICYNLTKEIQFVRDKYPSKVGAFKEVIWRNIQHYPVKEQINWLLEYSNFTKVYESEKLKVIELNIFDLRNEKKIAEEVSRWIKGYFKKQQNNQTLINVSLGSSETQVVWHILAESGLLPNNTRFIKTYDDKTDQPEKRLKKFSIREVPVNLIKDVSSQFKIYPQTQSASRELVNKKVQFFLKSGFSILLIGERGTGKSQIARNVKEELEKAAYTIKGKTVEANCASFDDDSKAEAELFGFAKGAFTGANADKRGLFEEANNGILFLDEVHHLSKFVQAKLMRALQTDENNKMYIRRMGDNKEIQVECRLIFATNKTVDELKEILLPDFYDRIAQHVVSIPPLRHTREDLEKDWETVWKQLKFKDTPAPPKEKQLIDWLKTLPLYGNFRDLQKIAMYYNIFNEFDDETQKLLKEKTAFQYAKNEFEKYHSPIHKPTDNKFNFDPQKTTTEMIAEYKFELQKWAVSTFGGRTKAVEHFSSLGEKITEKTFNNWKNKKRNRENKKARESS